MPTERVTFKKRWSRRLSKLRRLFRRSETSKQTLPHQRSDMGGSTQRSTGFEKPGLTEVGPTHAGLGRMTSQTPSLSAMLDSTNRIAATTPLEGGDITESPFQPLRKHTTSLPDPDVHSQSAPLPGRPASPSSTASGLPTTTLGRRPRLLQRAVTILQQVPTATWSVILGLLFSLVQPLKALLTTTQGWTGSRMPNAPDNNPPLHFILDTAAYIGALTVPLGLMLLGSSFARLKVSISCCLVWVDRAYRLLPSRIQDVPIMAIVSMTFAKSEPASNAVQC